MPKNPKSVIPTCAHCKKEFSSPKYNLQGITVAMSKVTVPTTNRVVQDGETKELFTAARIGNLSTLKQLKMQGVDMSAKHAKGYTIAHIAAAYGHLEVLKWLFEHGLELDVKDNGGSTPVHFAAICGHLEVLKWLFEHGLELNVKVNLARIPVHLAAENGHLEVVKWLKAQELNLKA
jgi:ankyrin repeat protein